MELLELFFYVKEEMEKVNCSALSPMEVVLNMAQDPTAGHFDNASDSHRILHMIVMDDNYIRISVMLATRCVIQAVYEKVARETMGGVIQFMGRCAQSKSLRGIYGQIFESFYYDQLLSGKLFSVRSLETENDAAIQLDLQKCDSDF